jgi:NTP pyrophosphatase (non-canonical NTP hydrolase)
MSAGANSEYGQEEVLPLPLPTHLTLATPQPALKRRNVIKKISDKGVSAGLLTDLQKEVAEIEVERGTIRESISQKSLLLTEEIFEVIKVLRAESGIATSKRPAIALADELADVMFVCAAIANRVPTDLGLVWIDNCRVHAPVPGSRPVTTPSVLAGALQLAEQVLKIVTIVPTHGPVHVDSELAESLSVNLVGLLSSVDAFAARKKIDLGSALDSKLQKDQLRLWQ